MIRRISGKPDPAATSHLIVNNTTIEQPTEIADILSSTISHNSSSDHYTDKFQRYKAHQDKRAIKFTSDDQESYNLPFSMTELQTALHKSHDSSAGPDSIHYQMLKLLPDSAQSTLLRVFNDLWQSGDCSKSWLNATIIPIPKPGKDPTSPNNYD